MLKHLLSLLILLCPTISYAQIVVDEEYGQGQPIVLSLKLPEVKDSKTIALWEFRQGAYREFGTQVAFWPLPSQEDITYLAECIVFQTKSITVEGQTFDVLLSSPQKFRSTFKVHGVMPPSPNPNPNPPGPNPPGPNPNPSPNIPDDKFGNIGKQVNAWISETIKDPVALSKRTDLANLYIDLANKLRFAEFINISDSNKYLLAKKAEILTPQAVADAWSIVGSRINAHAGTLDLSNRVDLVEFYRALAVGIKGQ